ncbi:SGNH/GDSL hydrolase family protein [Mesorhizobium sp. M0968]|uniref:SGNH/GDSL hydrolase family protein n=1 Tax=Mesorhizobium sp. M0968 TaxID=2957037 RepID=UPI003339AC23
MLFQIAGWRVIADFESLCESLWRAWGSSMKRLSARAGHAGLWRLLFARSHQEDPFAAIVRDPSLPNLLLIGDSISMAYTVPVRKLLSGRFNVERIPVNSTNSARLLAGLDEWINREYDVIHFNAGLHDLKRVPNPAEVMLEQDSIEGGERWIEPAAYRENMRNIMRRLKMGGARVIVATTTPVPPEARHRMAGEEQTYNAILRSEAKGNSVEINDLRRFILPFLSAAQRPRDVHFNETGSLLLAGQVAAAVLARATPARRS